MDNLLPGSDPIGKEIRVDTGTCEIIGVAKKRGSVMGQSQDNWVIMPLTTYQAMYARDDSVRLWVKATGTQALDSTMDEVRMILRGRRHLEYATPRTISRWRPTLRSFRFGAASAARSSA